LYNVRVEETESGNKKVRGTTPSGKKWEVIPTKDIEKLRTRDRRKLPRLRFGFEDNHPEG
jgi:hypothetical protein